MVLSANSAMRREYLWELSPKYCARPQYALSRNRRTVISGKATTHSHNHAPMAAVNVVGAYSGDARKYGGKSPPNAATHEPKSTGDIGTTKQSSPAGQPAAGATDTEEKGAARARLCKGSLRPWQNSVSAEINHQMVTTSYAVSRRATPSPRAYQLPWQSAGEPAISTPPKGSGSNIKRRYAGIPTQKCRSQHENTVTPDTAATP